MMFDTNDKKQYEKKIKKILIILAIMINILMLIMFIASSIILTSKGLSIVPSAIITISFFSCSVLFLIKSTTQNKTPNTYICLHNVVSMAYFFIHTIFIIIYSNQN